MLSDDDDDYGFEYSDEDESDEEADTENQYFKAKEMSPDADFQDRVAAFTEVLSLEREEGKKGEWGFKALKRLVKLHFARGDFPTMLESYRELLTYIKSAVTRNMSEKSINRILDLVSSSQSLGFLEVAYSETLNALKEAKNDRLWFKANLKLANLYFQRQEYTSLVRLCSTLKKSCMRADGTEDQSKGSQLLEVYALEIQMYTEMKNNKRLKEVYNLSLHIKNVIIHPRIMGVIRECGGKMHMYERQFDDANTDFFEAFKCYDEVGSPRRIQCLKYLVLANMLTQRSIDPFNAQETRSYQNDAEVVAFTTLVKAYQDNNIPAFERILHENEESIMGDPFIRLYIEDLLKNIRTAKLLDLIRPYTSIRLAFVAAQLNAPLQTVESLCVSLILDGAIAGKIDQVNQILILEGTSHSTRKYLHLGHWAREIRSEHNACVNRLR